MKLLRFFVPAAAALLFAQAALAAFPYSSSGGTSTTSLRCSNNPCKTCTSNANCGTGYICKSTSYVPPYCMNGYSTVIFDDSDPRLAPLVVDFVPYDPADDSLGEVRITGALVAQYSEDPGYKAVYRVKGKPTDGMNSDDPAGLKGIRYQGVTKTPVEDMVPVCSDQSCEQARIAYSVVLKDGSDLAKVLTGKLVYDDELTWALFGAPTPESPFYGCIPNQSTPFPPYCEILVGVGPTTITSTSNCTQAFPPVDTPFGFSVGACEILRLEEKCVTCKLDALGLVNDPVFGSRENFEACDGFGVVARMCNDAQSTGTPNCFGLFGNEPRGELTAFVGDEAKAQEPAQEVTLVYVGPTLQNLIDALRPYGVVNGQTEDPDKVGDPIFLVPAAASQVQMLLPSVVSPTELRFTSAEAGGTVITGLNITGWGQGDKAVTEPLLIESPDTKNVVWDFSGMGLVVERLVMGSGNGTVYGSTAPDVILAGNGVDRIYGNEGGDCLDGQQNDDHIWGGPGADVFVLSGSFGRDTIYDFNAAEGDVIVNITGKSASSSCPPTTSSKCTIKVSGAGTVTVNLAEGGTGPSSLPPSLSGLGQCQGHPAYYPNP